MFATGLGAALFQKQRALSAVMPICVVLDLRTSPIDSPPGQSPEANLALEELSLSIHPEDSAFGFDDWNRIATYTDQYIRLAGDLFQAAHAYTARWRLGRAPANLSPFGIGSIRGYCAARTLRTLTTIGYLWRFSIRRPGASGVRPVRLYQR